MYAEEHCLDGAKYNINTSTFLMQFLNRKSNPYFEHNINSVNCRLNLIRIMDSSKNVSDMQLFFSYLQSFQQLLTQE